MGMEPARATWTDQRLDDLAMRVDRDLRDLRREVKSDVAALRAEMITRFGSLERTIHWFGGGMLLTFAAPFLAVLLGQS